MIEPELYQELLGRLRIQDVYLRGDKCIGYMPPTLVPEQGILLSPKFEYLWQISAENSLLLCFPIATVTGETKDGDKLFALQATFVFVYQMTTVIDNQEFVDLFTSRNVFFQAIPYFREFFQNQLQRLGYPRIVMPMLQPGYSVAATKVQEDTQGEESCGGE